MNTERTTGWNGYINFMLNSLFIVIINIISQRRGVALVIVHLFAADEDC